MRELEDSRSGWEDRLRHARNLTPDDLAELRYHLDDSIEELAKLGLPKEEATLLALRRIGDPGAIAAEYLKVGPGDTFRERMYWATSGVVGFLIAIGLIRLLSHVGTWMALGGGWEKTWFLGLGMTGVGLIFLVVTTAARAPYGRVARALQRGSDWARHRPLRFAHLAFSTLAGVTILDHFATDFVWRLAWPDGYAAIGALEAMIATAVPVGLLLLTGYLSQGDEDPSRN